MGKKHQVSHLVSDLSGLAKSSTAAAPAADKPKAAAAPAASTLPRSKFRTQKDFSSSDEDEEDNAAAATSSTAAGAAKNANYVAMPNKGNAAAAKRPRAEEESSASASSSAAAAGKKKVVEKAAVVETLTIGNKVVTKTTREESESSASEEDDDDDDNVSIDSFDAEAMNTNAKPLKKKNNNNNNKSKKQNDDDEKVPALIPADKVKKDSDDESDDDEEFENEEMEEGEDGNDSWDDEDLEALMAMPDSDEESEGDDEEEQSDDGNSDDDDMIDEEDSDAPSDDDEDDDDYKKVATELAKAKKTETANNSQKGVNPNKQDDSVVVNFDAFGFDEDDIEGTIHLLDNYIPDKMNEVDRDEMAAILIAEPTTMIIKQGERDSDDDDDDEDDDDSDNDDGDDDDEDKKVVMNNDGEDIFAIYSLLPISNAILPNGAPKKQTPSVVKGLSTVLANPWATMQRAPTTLNALLATVNGGAKAAAAASAADIPALLLVMDHIKTVPIDVTLAALDNIIADAEGADSEEEARYTKKQLANAKIICMAKIQRNAEKDNEKTKKGAAAAAAAKKAGGAGAGVPGENNNKKRNAQISSSKVDKSDINNDDEANGVDASAFSSIPNTFEEAAMTVADAAAKAKEDRLSLKAAIAAENNGFNLSDYVFWRPFEEALYDRRDTSVCVNAFKCRAQYDEQPDNDRPISVVFAVTWNGLKSAVASVRNLAVPTVPTGFF